MPLSKTSGSTKSSKAFVRSYHPSPSRRHSLNSTQKIPRSKFHSPQPHNPNITRPSPKNWLTLLSMCTRSRSGEHSFGQYEWSFTAEADSLFTSTSLASSDYTIHLCRHLLQPLYSFSLTWQALPLQQLRATSIIFLLRLQHLNEVKASEHLTVQPTAFFKIPQINSVFNVIPRRGKRQLLVSIFNLTCQQRF